MSGRERPRRILTWRTCGGPRARGPLRVDIVKGATGGRFSGIGGTDGRRAGGRNRKSVAWHVARVLTEAGAKVVYVVRSYERRDQLAKLVPDADILVCDVAFPSTSRLWGSHWPAGERRSTATCTRWRSPTIRRDGSPFTRPPRRVSAGG